MPQDLHFAYIGRLWSHLIFDLRQGSQDLDIPLRRNIPGNVFESLYEVRLYPARACLVELKHSRILLAISLPNTPGILYLLTRCAQPLMILRWRY